MLFGKSGRGLVRAALMLLVTGALSNLVTGSATAELIGHWTLDDGLSDPGAMIAVDSSGKGHDGELTDFLLDPLWVDGKYGGALNFGAELGAIVADMGDDLPLDNEPRTVAAWINLDFPAQAFFASYGAGGAGRQFNIGVEDNGGIPNIRLRHGGGNMFFQEEVLEAEWNHVAAVVPDGAVVTADVLMYLNGEEVISENPTNVVLATALSSFVIGGKWDVAANRAFEGLVDDVRVFNEALDQQAIQAIMAGAGLEPPGDPGDFNLDGTVDVNDFMIMAANFNGKFPAKESFSKGDFDLNTRVNLKDFLDFRKLFHAQQGVAAASVPEPSTFTLLGLAGTLLLTVGSRYFAARKVRPRCRRIVISA